MQTVLFRNGIFVAWLALISLSPISGVRAAQMFLDFNSGSGRGWTGWTWYDDANGYGQPGWRKDDGQTYRWGFGPRSFNIGTDSSHRDDSRDLAEIDTTERAPSTATGGSFHVYNPPGVNINVKRASWWVWYDGEPLSNKGFTNSDTDRWEFYIKTDSPWTIPEDGESGSVPSNNFHVGTYICWDDGGPAYGTGDGCPYEGPGNQHYYHYFTFNPGAWVNVQLDQHPNHRRGSCVQGTYNEATNTVYGNDPTFFESGKHYLEHLHQTYFEISTMQNEQDTAYWLDEMKFYSSQETPEPHQNEISISSPHVGYWPVEDHWEMGWQDLSFGSSQFLPGQDTCSHRNDDTLSTFEIRWSTAPITNENFGQANRITPLFYGGIKHAGAAHLVRRQNAWGTVVWTRFQLPDNIEQNYNRIYFAIKDVSVAGGNVGTQWPWNRGDGHDAPTGNIRIIDYYIRPDVPGIHADFMVTQRTVEAGQNVQFADVSSGGPTSWSWDFDNDGSADATQQHPSYIYQTPGTYSISLTVSDGGQSDGETKADYITVLPSSKVNTKMFLYIPPILGNVKKK